MRCRQIYWQWNYLCPLVLLAWKVLWETSKESNLTMQSILFSFLITYTKAFDLESKGIIIKTKNETNYLATTRLKNTVQGNLEAPQTIPWRKILSRQFLMSRWFGGTANFVKVLLTFMKCACNKEAQETTDWFQAWSNVKQGKH